MEQLNKIFKAAEIAKIDKYTIEHEPISSLQLMERASRIFVENLLEKFGYNQKIAVVAGCGNNGGDGYAIARLLADKGLDVIVYRLSGVAAAAPDCEVNSKQWRGKTVEVRTIAEFEPDKKVVIIDAIFGSGLNRKIEGLAAEVIQKINRLENWVVAVDMPSGLMGEDNSENNRDAIVKADYTFTFQFPKLAFMLPENAEYVGIWKVLDVGLNKGYIASLPSPYHYLTEEVITSLLPLQPKFAHKGTNGHGLLIAGSRGMMGAAVLAAKAAVHSGIGLVSCSIPFEERQAIHVTVPECLVDIREIENRLMPEELHAKYSALAVGPGTGKSPDMVAAVKYLLTHWQGVAVWDADALNIMADHPELLTLLHEGAILTPHIREFERLTGKCSNDFERLNKLSNFASRYKIYVVLKGAHTVVATPDGKYYFNMSGNPGMAKGGAGDVLTGVLLALLANGIEPLHAALIGVFAHGLTGDLLAEEKGMRGVCSGEIAQEMGRAWKRLEVSAGLKK